MKGLAIPLFLLICCLFSCKKTTPQINPYGGLSQFKNFENTISGYIEVPENRDAKNEKKIKLAYLVLKAEDHTTKKEPIVYLQGGPGGATLFMAYFFRNHKFRLDRDIILMDQRGTGASNAICTDLGEKMLSILAKDFTPEQEYHSLLEEVILCKEEAENLKTDLSAYNSKENAADFEDLRKNLGYKQWNLFGGSYGSRLGLTLIRDFPQSIRSAILFGVFPPEIDLYRNFIDNFKQSLFKTFGACANDLQCNAQYPELPMQFSRAMEQLNAKPIRLTNNQQDFVLNTQDALLVLHQLLYNKSTIAQIPSFIHAIRTIDLTTYYTTKLSKF